MVEQPRVLGCPMDMNYFGRTEQDRQLMMNDDRTRKGNSGWRMGGPLSGDTQDRFSDMYRPSQSVSTCASQVVSTLGFQRA